MDVSIIIVNYNTKEMTKNCLRSIYQQTRDIEFEVIVSDNGSKDGSIDMIKTEFPDVYLIENNENLGFGSANNRGLEIAKGKYIFYLNSDTILLNNSVKIFFDYWENSPEKKQIGALGGILLDKHLKKIHSGGALPSMESIKDSMNKILCVHKRNTRLKKIGLSWLHYLISELKQIIKIENINVGEIGYVTGADLFLLNNSMAYFDENFFMYYEETDLQLRIANQGLKRCIISGPKIMHLTRKSSINLNISNFATLNMQISALKYIKKNFGIVPKEIYFPILEDWQNPYVRKILKKYELFNFEKELFKLI